MKFAKMAAAIVFAVTTISMSGCSAINKVYVEADRLTYNAIAPEFLWYVGNDDTLEAAQKERRARTIEAWLKRIEEAESQLGN